MTIKSTGFQNSFTDISELWDTEDNLTYADTLSHTLTCSDITLTRGQRRGHASASSDRGRNRASEWRWGQDPGSWLWGAALGSVMTPFPTHLCTAWNRPRLSSHADSGHCLHVLYTPLSINSRINPLFLHLHRPGLTCSDVPESLLSHWSPTRSCMFNPSFTCDKWTSENKNSPA